MNTNPIAANLRAWVYHEPHDPLEIAADALDAIDAMHRDDGYRNCDCCAEDWPCPTHRLLHPDAPAFKPRTEESA